MHLILSCIRCHQLLACYAAVLLSVQEADSAQSAAPFCRPQQRPKHIITKLADSRNMSTDAQTQTGRLCPGNITQNNRFMLAATTQSTQHTPSQCCVATKHVAAGAAAAPDHHLSGLVSPSSHARHTLTQREVGSRLK